MLVITRRPNEGIVIETDEAGELSQKVEVVVLGIRGRQVRIGIKAPREIIVHREEVYQRNQQTLQTDQQESPLSISE